MAPFRGVRTEAHIVFKGCEGKFSYSTSDVTYNADNGSRPVATRRIYLPAHGIPLALNVNKGIT